jgi:hypothetical protein
MENLKQIKYISIHQKENIIPPQNKKILPFATTWLDLQDIVTK